MYQGNTLKFGQNITELGGVSLQKLTPGRNIEKEILNRKIASFGTKTPLPDSPLWNPQ